MRHFFSTTASALKRVLISPSFLVAILGLAALNIISVYQEMALVQNRGTVIYIYNYGLYSNFWILFLVFGAIPGATLFCTDWENRYIRFSVLRAGKGIYGATTAFVCFLSSILAVFLGECLFFIILCFRYPLVSEYHLANLATGVYSIFEPLFVGNKLILFFLIRFLLKACCAGFYAVFALWFSTKITNVFVSALSPIIFNYLWENIVVLFQLPDSIRFDRLAKGYVSINDNLLWTILYPLILFAFLAAMFGILFTLAAKRRVENG